MRALGAFIDGFLVTGAFLRRRSAFDWLTPFSGYTRSGDRLLCAAGGHLADLEDRGRAARADDRGVPPGSLTRSCWWGSESVSLWKPLDPPRHRRAAMNLDGRVFFSSRQCRSWWWRLTGDSLKLWPAGRGTEGLVPRAAPFLLSLFLLFLGYGE